MSIKIGHTLEWRFQGIKSSCWLTSIEMVMKHKYGSIYGKHAKHSAEVMRAFDDNRGCQLSRHAKHFGLKPNEGLRDSTCLKEWETALRNGPVLAEGNYCWSRFGSGLHVIVIAGISEQGKLAFYNPNVFALLPHPVSKISYFTLAECIKNSRSFGESPFWQVADDIPARHQSAFGAAALTARK